MYIGFNLRLDKVAKIFKESNNYKELQKIGEKHLKDQEADYERDLKTYVNRKEIDGTKIQKEWFPQVNADIFISHSHNDKELACALAGWLHEKFGLKCFIDSNVWGYSDDLLKEMNDRLSDKREDEKGEIVYDHQSCNQVSQHVNMMLSVALQKMIDKVEVIIFLNTENSVKVCSDTKMEKTYSPWIYSEIVCTQSIRKKPLLAYRNYKRGYQVFHEKKEGLQYLEYIAISYNISLKHLNLLSENDLAEWERVYNSKGYEYALDALYDFKFPKEVEKTKRLFATMDERRLRILKHVYSD